MYGAILGDIIGSRFEFDRGGKTKYFDLFTKYNKFTDDTVMTVAVADALIYSGPNADTDAIKENVINSMVHWAKKYPNAGYGGRFYEWLFKTKNRKPYGSYGNGSAMRVSAAGWLYDSLERTTEVARATAEVTHNHPEGIKGATCTAEVIYLARTGKSKDEIREYILSNYDYDIDQTVDQLREKHEHIESCQDSMPKALVSFFEGTDYEDVVRNAVSLGGDTDTLAAIAGAMAEAFYGITISTIVDGTNYIPEDMLKVMNKFTDIKNRQQDRYIDNHFLDDAIDLYYKDVSKENLLILLNAIIKRIEEQGVAPSPMINVNNVQIDVDNLKVGESFSLDDELRLKIDRVEDGDGKQWIPLYTSEEEIFKGNTSNIIFESSIVDLLIAAYNNDEVDGMVINPFGQSFTLPKDLLKLVYDFLKLSDE